MQKHIVGVLAMLTLFLAVPLHYSTEITGFDTLVFGMSPKDATSARPELVQMTKKRVLKVWKGISVLSPYFELENVKVFHEKGGNIELAGNRWSLSVFFENEKLSTIIVGKTTYDDYKNIINLKEYLVSLYKDKYGEPNVNELEDTMWFQSDKKIIIKVQTGKYVDTAQGVYHSIYIVYEGSSSLTGKRKNIVIKDKSKI